MQIDYVRAIGELYPDVHVFCNGDPTNYADLQHEGGGQIPIKEELDYMYMEYVKEGRIRELSDECAIRIRFGFISNALGVPKLYDSEEVDQLNLLGSVAMIAPTPENPEGTSTWFAIRDPALTRNNIRGPKEYAIHTHPQLKQVMIDGYNFKLGQLLNFNNKRDFINNNNLTFEQISQVTLDSVPGLI